MKQQSNNNLDALFQKAAEEYPLKTDNSNWDIVSAKLHNAPSATSLITSKKWPYAVLLLAVLTGGFFIISPLNKTSKYISEKDKTSVTQNSKSKESTHGFSNKFSVNKNVKNAQVLNKSISKPTKNSFTPKPLSYKASSEINSSFVYKNLPNLADHQMFSPQTQTSPNAILPIIENNNLNNSEKKSEEIINLKNRFANTLETNKKISSDNISNTSSQHLDIRLQPNTFYGTFFFSPEFSTVKFQHINKPGYKIGVALGYRITNRISAELGLERLHLNFYTSGDQFESHLKLKPTTEIKAVNGFNKLTEVPVDIKYNILKNSDKFFVTAGTAVATITHTQKYNYKVEKNGSPSYKDISRNFNSFTGTKYLSSINLSIGYQGSISDFLKIKIEPYYQTPTKGLGISNLPVNNFGMNIGIIKDLN